MANWILTLGLQNLRAQVNAAFPARDKASDGTIGDAAHQAGTSSHNPDDSPENKGRPEWNGDPDSTPEVRAWDMDTDLNAPPATAQQVVDHIRHLPGASSVLRYMIYNRKIYKAENGWKPEAYTGPSPHTEHIHFTGQFTQAADNNTTFNYRLEEIPVAMTQADRDWWKSTLAAAMSVTVAAVKAEILAAVDDHLKTSGWSKDFPGRTEAQHMDDLQTLRGVVWGDTKAGTAPVGSPLDRMVRAADAVLAEKAQLT